MRFKFVARFSTLFTKVSGGSDASAIVATIPVVTTNTSARAIPECFKIR